jgi:hypothetical protein
MSALVAPRDRCCAVAPSRRACHADRSTRSRADPGSCRAEGQAHEPRPGERGAKISVLPANRTSLGRAPSFCTAHLQGDGDWLRKSWRACRADVALAFWNASASAYRSGLRWRLLTTRRARKQPARQRVRERSHLQRRARSADSPRRLSPSPQSAESSGHEGFLLPHRRPRRAGG